MAKGWNRFAQWPIQFGVALLLAGALARPADAGTTYNVSDVVQLEAAVAAVNAGGGGDLIVLASGFYVLKNELGIRQDVTIQGDSLALTEISGTGSFALLEVWANNVSIQNLTLRDGYIAVYYAGGGVFSGTGLTITGSQTGIHLSDGEGVAFLTNSTIADNVFGIRVECSGLHLANVTVTGNQTGIYFTSCSEPTHLTNSLIVANINFDCGGGVDPFGGALLDPFGDASFDSDGSCVALGFGPGMTTVALPALDLRSLANNGGPTLTAAIPPTSAAVDAGTNTGCPATDQRGSLRNDGACDIGAYEQGPGVGGDNTQPGLGVVVSPAPGVTVTFTKVDTLGDTTATTGGPAPPIGFQVDGLVYDISTTAGFTGNVTVCLPFNPASNPTPILAHYENIPPPVLPPLPPNMGWVDRTTGVDSVNHVVCGVVSSLSPFAVLMPVDVSGRLQQLRALVESFNLRKPVAKRFIHRLDEVRDALVRKHHHKDRPKKFCKELEKFIKGVLKQSGKTLTAEEAGQLLALAQLIASDAGCGS